MLPCLSEHQIHTMSPESEGFEVDRGSARPVSDTVDDVRDRGERHLARVISSETRCVHESYEPTRHPFSAACAPHAPRLSATALDSIGLRHSHFMTCNLFPVQFPSDLSTVDLDRPMS
jgi:hypothetical protein